MLLDEQRHDVCEQFAKDTSVPLDDRQSRTVAPADDTVASDELNSGSTTTAAWSDSVSVSKAQLESSVAVIVALTALRL